jgi:DNA-binding response OmpR family regulator
MNENCKPNILLADDDEMLLKLGKAHFERAGFSVILCRNGQEAVDQARTQHPDVVIVDVLMPELDGWQVSRLLKADQETSDIPVYLLTALGDEEHIQRHRDADADGYFIKPFRMEVLIKRLHDIIRKRHTEENESHVV